MDLVLRHAIKKLSILNIIDFVMTVVAFIPCGDFCLFRHRASCYPLSTEPRGQEKK